MKLKAKTIDEQNEHCDWHSKGQFSAAQNSQKPWCTLTMSTVIRDGERLPKTSCWRRATRDGASQKAENKWCWAQFEDYSYVITMFGDSRFYMLGNTIKTAKLLIFSIVHLLESKNNIGTSRINPDNICNFIIV